MKRSMTLAALAALCLAVPAHAQDSLGWYLQTKVTERTSSGVGSALDSIPVKDKETCRTMARLQIRNYFWAATNTHVVALCLNTETGEVIRIP